MIDPDAILQGFSLASLAGDSPAIAAEFILSVGDPQDPRQLLLSVLRQAAKNYHDSKAALQEANRRYYASDDVKRHEADNDDRVAYEATLTWERWCDVASAAHEEARDHLVFAILTAHGRIRYRSEMEKLKPDPNDTWEPVAFELDGVLWVVGQAPDDDKFNAVLLAVDRDSYDGDAFGDD